MRVGAAEDVVTRFNAMINARDLDGLAALMTPDHTFVDSTGGTVAGRRGCVEAWRGFFAAFPSYRNEFSSIRATAGFVIVTGRSRCTELAELDGPALWTAVTDGDLVREWRVYEDTRPNRRALGVAEDRAADDQAAGARPGPTSRPANR
jgi:ketosteroid isomerase-like protein